MGPADMPALARLIARALVANDARTVADDVTAFRRRFSGLWYVRA
jgi:hypothetical protein